MILANDFTVDAPVRDTWRALLDVERVAGCLPGASIEPPGEDGIHHGGLALKLGPVRMSYTGTVQLQDVDEDALTMTLHASARERVGTGTASATIRARVQPAGDGVGTRVDVETDLAVTGRAAQFGRGIMQEVAGTMLGTFADGLRTMIADAGEGPGRPDGPGDAVARAVGAAEIPPDAGAGPHGPSPRSDRPDPEDVLDLGGGLRSLIAPRRAAVGATALVAAGLLVSARRGRRRGSELTLTLRLR